MEVSLKIQVEDMFFSGFVLYFKRFHLFVGIGGLHLKIWDEKSCQCLKEFHEFANIGEVFKWNETSFLAVSNGLTPLSILEFSVYPKIELKRRIELHHRKLKSFNEPTITIRVRNMVKIDDETMMCVVFHRQTFHFIVLLSYSTGRIIGTVTDCDENQNDYSNEIHFTKSYWYKDCIYVSKIDRLFRIYKTKFINFKSGEVLETVNKGFCCTKISSFIDFRHREMLVLASAKEAMVYQTAVKFEGVVLRSVRFLKHSVLLEDVAEITLISPFFGTYLMIGTSEGHILLTDVETHEIYDTFQPKGMGEIEGMEVCSVKNIDSFKIFVGWRQCSALVRIEDQQSLQVQEKQISEDEVGRVSYFHSEGSGACVMKFSIVLKSCSLSTVDAPKFFLHL